LFTIINDLNKNAHVYRIVGVATTAGAKALPKPSGVSGGQDPLYIVWKKIGAEMAHYLKKVLIRRAISLKEES